MSLRDYLIAREAELLKERGGYLEKVAGIEIDLAETRRALAALGAPEMPGLLRLATGLATPDGVPYREWTLKQLAVRALQDHFPYGATANQLLAVFESHYAREIARESLSPQLSRLKDDNIIKLEGKLWKLATQERETPPSRDSGVSVSTGSEALRSLLTPSSRTG